MYKRQAHYQSRLNTLGGPGPAGPPLKTPKGRNGGKLGYNVFLPSLLGCLGERCKLLKTLLIHFQFERTCMMATNCLEYMGAFTRAPFLHGVAEREGALGHTDIFNPTIGIGTVLLMMPQ